MSGVVNTISHFRDRVQHRVKQIPHYPITLILSPPGYGKRQFLQEMLPLISFPICQVTLEKKDRYLKEFLMQLTNALNHTFPTTNWEEVNQPIYPSILFDEDVAYSWLNYIKSKVEALQHPVMLILEHYDRIDEDSFIQKLLNRFINMLPNNLHLVITSRYSPTGEAFKRAELQNRILEINEYDLRMTPADIKGLFHEYYQISLTDQEIEAIYQLTLGWKMPLHTIYLFLSRGGNVEQMTKDPVTALSTFFDYIDTEISKAFPKMIQGFLNDISFFDELDIELLSDLNYGSTTEMIQVLEKHRVLTYTNDSNHKELHPLIKLFYRSKADPEAIKILHRKVSYHYMEKENYAASIPFLIGAHEWEELAYLISTIGGKLIYFGNLKAVMEGIQALPSAYKAAFPRTLIVEGDYYRLHSEYSTALARYQQAYEACSAQGDLEGTMLAIEGEVQVYLDTVKPNKAQSLLKKAYYNLKISSDRKARLLHLMAENYINSGKPKRAKRMIALSRKLSLGVNSEVQESRLMLRTGQLHAVDALLQKEETKQKKMTPLIHGFRETSLVHSIVNAFMGEAVFAKKRAQQGILLGTQLKSPFIEATGWARMGHAMMVVTPFNFQLTEQCYLTSLQIFEEIGIEWGQAEPLMGLCLLHGFAGNADLAFNYGNEACRIAKGVTDQWMYHMTLLCIGIAAFTVAKYEDAVRYLDEGITGIRKCGDYFLEAAMQLWLAYVHFMQENEDAANKHFNESLTLISQYGYDFLLQKRSLFGARDLQTNVPLLLQVQQQKNVNSAFASKMLKELGFSQVKFHPGYTLRIDTLGGFRVWLGAREVLDKDWQRANAKRLFQYLVTKRRQEMLKEVIQLDLWSDLDDDALDRDFKVALNALSKALEPDRKARSSSFYITRNGSAYRLNPDSGYELDAEQFQTCFEEALREKDVQRAKAKFETGYQLYKGDFLADNLYEDWAIEERERLQVLYLRGCERYARLLLNDEEYEQSIKVAEKIVEKDPCWEEAYRIIMYSYYKLMNRTMALRWYEKCKQNLNLELGVEPMLTTQRLKEHIQNGVPIELDPLS